MAQVVQGQKVARLKLFGRSPVCVSLGCELLTLRRNFFSFILLFSLSLHFNERRRNKQRHCLWIIQLGLSKEEEGHLLLFLSPPAAAKFKRGFIKSPLRCPGRQSMIVLLYKDSFSSQSATARSADCERDPPLSLSLFRQLTSPRKIPNRRPANSSEEEEEDRSASSSNSLVAERARTLADVYKHIFSSLSLF